MLIYLIKLILESSLKLTFELSPIKSQNGGKVKKDIKLENKKMKINWLVKNYFS